MTTRRNLLLALGAGPIAWCSWSWGQQKAYRVGILQSGTRSMSSESLYEVVAAALGKLGYVEGRNLIFEHRHADGNSDRLPALAADLVRLKVDVILVGNTPPAQATKRATDTIPIVFTTVADPVGSGIVASLTRPGGNITGTSVTLPDLSAKRLQLLKEVAPRISRIAAFVAPDEPQTAPQLAEVEQAGRSLGMEVLPITLRRREDFEKTLAVVRKWRADSTYGVGSNANFLNRAILAEFAAMARLPSSFPTKGYVEAGGLMSYGASYEAIYQRAAHMVDKILRGTKPADIPVELPAKFEMVVSLKTAKALGLTIPQPFLMRADRVIE